jgi:hypothetical protein
MPAGQSRARRSLIGSFRVLLCHRITQSPARLSEGWRELAVRSFCTREMPESGKAIAATGRPLRS